MQWMPLRASTARNRLFGPENRLLVVGAIMHLFIFGTLYIMVVSVDR